jgi:pimeloyl-ACP methyl ester carboxylesterase
MWPPAFFGDGARTSHPFPDDGRRLAFLDSECTRPRRVHLDAQVHPIQQRSGQLAEVSPPRQPILLIWGDQDRIIPVAHGYAAHDAVAGSRLEVLAGVGHFPHVESPTAVVEILDDFIATTGPMPI